MKNMKIFWVFALLITILAAFYQRTTGPTYPKRQKAIIDGGEYKLSLKRSQNTKYPCEIKLEIDNESVSANLYYHRFPVNEEFTTVAFERRDNELVALLPTQPSAGKLQYYIEINSQDGTQQFFKDDNVVIRFKDNVPAYIMIPHIFFMFFAMLISTLAGLLAGFNKEQFRKYAFVAIALLFVGGMILGPFVQKFAFGEFWTGIPFGWDLTDNKTLIAVVAWVAAVVANLKKPRRWWVLAAAIVLLMVYSIPHSMFGSELDYTTGSVTTGK